MTCVQTRCQNLFNKDLKNGAIRRPFKNERFANALEGESCQKGEIGSSVAWNCTIRPLSFGRSGIQAGQSDVGTAFIDKDQLARIECLGLFSPSCTLLFLLFARAQCLFLPRPVQALDRTAHRRGAYLETLGGFPDLTMFRKRCIGGSIELRL